MNLKLTGDERYSVFKFKKRFDGFKRMFYLCKQIGKKVKLYLKWEWLVHYTKWFRIPMKFFKLVVVAQLLGWPNIGRASVWKPCASGSTPLPTTKVLRDKDVLFSEFSLKDLEGIKIFLIFIKKWTAEWFFMWWFPILTRPNFFSAL